MGLSRRAALETLTKDELVQLARKNGIYFPLNTTKTGMGSRIMKALPKDVIMSEILLIQSSKLKQRASSGVKRSRCTQMYTKHYTDRPSPPYPANLCCRQYKTGNDGYRYKSVPDYRGVCRWQRIKY